MNIEEAKEEILHTLTAYWAHREDGTPRIPVEKQRPLLLIGPPGIGKTAIMKQIAAESGAGLLAYTMTHHTRQSAIGLPFIAERTYNGKPVSITEYTMSEIIASIYDYMEESGKTKGILFLDEINCVSETLAPIMLELLQNKTFGRHPLPPDWIIVAAGNPPEYNKSVRDFDMVTLDRVRNITIEADLGVFRSYAVKEGLHPAVRTYLSLYPDHFCNITDTDRGQKFVTARGWEDLSLMLTAYEDAGLVPRRDFFAEYLQHEEIARSFGVYYELFTHYSARDGAIPGIPAAEASDMDEDAFSFSGPSSHAADKKPPVSRNAFQGPDIPFLARLQRNPLLLEKASATECLSIATILFHAIREGAASYTEAKAKNARLLELIGLIPADTNLLLEREREAFFEQKYNAVGIRVAHKLMKPAEEFREKACLRMLEDLVISWVKEVSSSRVSFAEPGGAASGSDQSMLAKERVSAASDFRTYATARVALMQKETTAAAETVSADIAAAYEVLTQCPEGRISLLYLTGDLDADPACHELLTDLPVESFLAMRGELTSYS